MTAVELDHPPAPLGEGGARMPTSNGLLPEAFGPLQGVKILSTGTLIAEPFAAHLAAAFGAEVIHVEHPSGTVDPWRVAGTPPGQTHGRPAGASGVLQERRHPRLINPHLCNRGG